MVGSYHVATAWLPVQKSVLIKKVKNGGNKPFLTCIYGGDGRDRTDDLLNAIYTGRKHPISEKRRK